MSLRRADGRPTLLATALAAAAALAAAVAVVVALTFLTGPEVYLPAMAAVLGVEVLVGLSLLLRRLSRRRPGRRLRSVASGRPEMSPKRRQRALETARTAAGRAEHGFLADSEKLLQDVAADPAQPREAREIAARALRTVVTAAAAPRREEHFDVVIVSNFNLPGGTTASNANEIGLLAEAGKRVGLLHHPLYASNTGRPVNPKIEELVDGESVRYVQPRSKVSCELLVMRFPPFAERLRDDLPSIEARESILVVNQAPMSYYDAVGGRKPIWDPALVHRTLSDWIGPHRWFAAGPAVHRVLVEHHGEELRDVALAADYWYPTLDLARLGRRGPEAPEGPVVIGRHSRDHQSKWPELAADLRACYPEGPDWEIRVLGGARAAERILGRLPSNWTVQGFDTAPVGEFLTGLDFYAYYPHSALLEAFGRAPVEAMAAGVPTVLPPAFEEVFGTGALYARPEEARELITALAGNPSEYTVQQKRGIEAVEQRFGFEAHRERFRSVGVEL
ncbi:glycosyltransferase family 1 protein [Glycomyces tenuis]|uniref:glycosyltransferase family 1 protein n=1 Tax=Glycomyces tenuis TaxID=58116 RepID=UPI0004281D0A|nr:glycosyltransferase family 1 protein [Glycomyces tenuis]